MSSDVRLAALSAPAPSTQQPARQGSSSKGQSQPGAVARAAAAACPEQRIGVTRLVGPKFIHWRLISPSLTCHALSRRGVGRKMGGGLLLTFLGILALAHGETCGSVEVLIRRGEGAMLFDQKTIIQTV